MNFRTAIDTGCAKWVTFSGRASRSEYWWISLWVLFVFILTLFLFILVSLFSGAVVQIRLAIALPPLIFALIVLISASIRRLHDCDYNGWWYAGFIVLALLSSIHIIFAALAFCAFLALIYIFVHKGTAEPNRYGQNPNTEAPDEKPKTGLPKLPHPLSNTDEDRELVRCLESFIGPNSDSYTLFYNKYFRDGKKSQPLSWHWPAALVPLPWLWYRKLYLWSYVFFLANFVIRGIVRTIFFIIDIPATAAWSELTSEILSFFIYLVFAALFGVFAKRIYVDHALRRIYGSHQRYPSTEERDAHLIKAGGVSVTGAVFASIIVISSIVLPLLVGR